MSDLISVAFACDENYAKHVGVVIKSILDNAAIDDRLDFHILTMELSPVSESYFREIAVSERTNLYIHRVCPKSLSGFPENRHTLNAYLRLFLPDILTQIEKVLYLDADLLVRKSLKELWGFSVANVAAGVAVDSMSIFKGKDLEHFEALKLPENHTYFNSGVMLLNLKVLREIQLAKEVKLWMNTYSNLMRHSDQDVLNVILANNVAYFHLRWNLQIPLIAPVLFNYFHTPEQAEAVSDPAILHYVTSRKPWHREFKLPYQNLYFHYLARTPWKDSAHQRLTLSILLTRFLEELEWLKKGTKAQLRKLLKGKVYRQSNR